MTAGRFTLIDQIGRGGSGIVWRAYDHRAEQYCAAKVVRASAAADLLRVVREQGLRHVHPHLLAPYAWVAEDDQALIASELMHGGSLAGLLSDQGRLPARYAAEILSQLLDGLGYLHRAGVLHRDVKPANVMLAASGQAAPHVRLGDFGIAMTAGEPRLTKTGYVVGTPGYVAPEVLQGAPPEPHHDVYAAGIVALQLLAGAEKPAPPPADGRRPVPMPRELWQVLRSMCASDPRDRPANAERARDLLLEAIAEVPLRLPAQTEDGEPIEIFDTLAPLPEDWTARAAESAGEPTQDLERVSDSQETALDVAAPSADSREVPDTREVPGAREVPDTRKLPGAREVPDARELPDVARVPRRAGARRPPGRRLAIAAVSLALVATAATAATLLANASHRNSPSHPGVDPTSHSSTVSNGDSPDASIHVGASCSFNYEATQATAADGRRVECTYRSGRYVWLLVQPGG